MNRSALVVLLATSLTLALASAACSSDSDDSGSSTGAGGTAGSGTAGSGTAGSGTAGSGTAGSGTAGSGTAGSGTAGSGTAGSGTAGSGTAGSSSGSIDCAGVCKTADMISKQLMCAPEDCLAACTKAVGQVGAKCEKQFKTVLDCGVAKPISSWECDPNGGSQLKDGECKPEQDALVACITGM